MRHYFVEGLTYSLAEPYYKICFMKGIVSLQQKGPDDFLVRYGKEIHAELNYGEAAKKLGEALMHQLACDSKIDNSRKTRRKGNQ